MTRRNPQARYALPQIVNPASRKCFVIRVPNEPYHLAAFRGQLRALSRAYAWGNDKAHTALALASVWADVIEEMEGCMPQFQFRQPSDCVLEVSFDSGQTWDEIYNGYGCAIGAIEDSIADGTIPVAQQPPGGEAPVMECFNYHVVLRGNDRWIAPIPVADGFAITIANARGGWSDGAAFGAYWQCPSGLLYSLGYCTGNGVPAQQGDPMQNQNHMRLIGYAGAYFDAYNTSYTVPNGTGQVDLYLMANDGTIGDNLGSIEFDITICNFSEWCYEFDFAAGSGSWVDWDGTGYWAQYSAGVGWIPGTQGYVDVIKRAIPNGTIITEIEATVYRNNSGPYDPGFEFLSMNVDGTPVYSNPQQAVGTGDLTITATGQWTGNTHISLHIGGHENPGFIWKRVKVRGTGAPPFGDPNC